MGYNIGDIASVDLRSALFSMKGLGNSFSASVTAVNGRADPFPVQVDKICRLACEQHPIAAQQRRRKNALTRLISPPVSQTQLKLLTRWF